MLDRNIQFGSGFQSVEGRGVIVVVSEAAKNVERTPDKRFTFEAKLCDSAEELQKSLSKAMSVSASVHGADLGANLSLSKTTDVTRFDSYYMMELEFREECASLDSLRENVEILEPSIRLGLESLDTVELWEDFYRTKGSHIVNSVTYGRKLIIIVSLKHKIQNDQLRQMMEANAGFTGAGDAKVSLESRLNALTEQNISSVRIYSIGDNDPNILKKIDILVTLKEKIRRFVNSAPKQNSDADTTAESSDEEPRMRTAETQKGVVIAYSTCPYIDFLSKQITNRKQIEIAYDQMLQSTNRASRYLEAITRCQSRLDLLLRSVDFYLTRHDGAFIVDHPTELAAGYLRDSLHKYTDTLQDIARDVVLETKGLSEGGQRRRSIRLEAKECLGLQRDVASTLTDNDIEETRLILSIQLSLIDKFEPMLNENGGSTLRLKQRFIDVQTVLEETEVQKKAYLQSLKVLRSTFDSEAGPYLKNRTALAERLMSIYQDLAAIADSRATKENITTSAEVQALLLELLESIKQGLGQEKALDPWLKDMASLYQAMVTEFKPILADDVGADPARTEPKHSYSCKKIQKYLQPLADLLMDWLNLIQRYNQRKEASYSYHETVGYVSGELDTIISLLNNIYSSNFGRFKKNYEDFSALKTRIDTEPHEASDRLSTVLEECRLKSDEKLLIKKISTEYIRKIEAQESSDAWWQDCWTQILNASQALDCIASNQELLEMPDGAKKIFTAIDFKREAFLVGILPVMRGWGFHKNEFNGNHYQNIKVPSNTRSLRFNLVGDNLPQPPVTFNLVSKPKIPIAGRKSEHHILYKKISPQDPIDPVQPSMRNLTKLLRGPTKTASLLQGEELMHSINETTIYRKVRIRSLRYNGMTGDIRKMSVLMYAQMGKGLDRLDLSKEAPKGIADYGVRVRTVDTIDALTIQKQQQSYRDATVCYQSQASGVIEKQTPQLVVVRQMPLRRRRSFFDEQQRLMSLQQTASGQSDAATETVDETLEQRSLNSNP